MKRLILTTAVAMTAGLTLTSTPVTVATAAPTTVAKQALPARADTPIRTLIEGDNAIWHYAIRVGHGTDDDGNTGFCTENDAYLHTDPRPGPWFSCYPDPSWIQKGILETAGAYYFSYAPQDSPENTTMALVGVGTPQKTDRVVVKIRSYKGKLLKTMRLKKKTSLSLVRDGKRERWFGFTWLQPTKKTEKQFDEIMMYAQQQACRTRNGKQSCRWVELAKTNF